MPSPDVSIPSANESYHGFAFVGYGSIGLVFGAFGFWAAFAPLDSAAVAPARVTVESERKPVQHLEGGIVREILVRDAERVKEGQVLFRLDPVASQANADLLRKQLDAATALEARLLAERAGEDEVRFPESLLLRANVTEAAVAMTEQQRLLVERRRSLSNQVGILETRIHQSTRDLEGRTRRLKSLREQHESLSAEIKALSDLTARGFFPRNRLRALERDRSRLEGDIGTADGDIARLEEVVEEARRQITQLQLRTREDATQQLAEVRTRLSDLRERLSVAEDVLSRVEVRAPRDGIVLNSQVRALGAVMLPGATLAEIVPMGDRLVLSARVSPFDIQSVAVSQKAEVRFPAFASQQAEPVFGRVATVSADAVQDEGTGEPFFLARVEIEEPALPRSVADHLVPGMPADVLIITGERTLLQYLVGPLTNKIARGFRER